MRKIINYTVNNKTKNVYRESFEVPCGTETIYIAVDLPEECRYMAFIILEDSKRQVRLQKLLGYGEQKLAVGNGGTNTSIGGVPGANIPGQWTLILGMFTEYVQQKLGGQEAEIKIILTDEAMEVTEPVGEWIWTKEGQCVISNEKYNWEKVYSSKSRWYKGDFHAHTTLSDGKDTTVRVTEKAKQMGMDFYVPTEHNLLHTGWCSADLCILPGLEVTTDKGHFNLFGVQEIPEKLREVVACGGQDVVEQYVREMMQEARTKGWLVSLNHPFLTIWSWRYNKVRIDEIDCVEIINDPTYPDSLKSNERAIHFVDALWQDGHRVYAVGGSDSHNQIDEYYEGADSPSIAGDPGTYVYCNSLTPAELMSHVRKGHMCITRFCRIEPSIRVEGADYLPGDEIPGEVGKEELLNYHVKITGLQEEPFLFLIVNGRVIPANPVHKADGSFETDMTLSLDFKEWTWIRMEVRKADGTFLGYVNPVYCGRKEPCLHTFGEIIKSMGEEQND
ncbi:MAG: CehA/McbA family metallohydrolase [Muricomes sp.]